jgi:CIC family chloride channel protein
VDVTTRARPPIAGRRRGAATVAARFGREALGLLVLAGVATAAAGFAGLFRETALGIVGRMSGTRDPTGAAERTAWPVVAAVVATAVALAAWIGHRADLRGRGRLGLTAIAAAARGEGPAPSLRATLLRGSGTLAAGSGLASLGRESAILEIGGMFGATAGRWLAGLGPALAAGGIGAAFAAAYHAPLAGVLYVDAHLLVRHRRRSALYALLGAALGHVVNVTALGGGPIFPGTQGPRWGMLVLAAIGVAPAVAGSRLFLELRERLTAAGPGRRLWSPPPATRVAVLALLTGVLVASLPLTAGNGMEALRRASTDAALVVVLSLAVGKLLATTAALVAGAPGGVFSPSLAVAAGWALLSFNGIDALGLDLPGAYWDGTLAAMAVGVAVGLRSPLVGLVAIPEMVGDLSLLPVCALAVTLASTANRRLDTWLGREAHRPPADIHDEDA